MDKISRSPGFAAGAAGYDGVPFADANGLRLWGEPSPGTNNIQYVHLGSNCSIIHSYYGDLHFHGVSTTTASRVLHDIF